MHRTGIFIMSAMIASQLTSPAGGFTIARDGVASARIVAAEDATLPERHAAEELAAFLGQVTGGTFDIVSSAEPGAPRILVGPDAACLADTAFSIDALGQEGIVIRTVGSDLILAGGRPRGTLYAVTTFLQDHVGCRWWMSAAATIPSKPTLEVGPLDVRYVPVLEYREPFWFDAFDGDWAARNRCNGHAHRLEEKHGGRINYAGFVHTFYHLVPPSEYFDEHPEWFSEIDGKRMHEGGQLCLTNEEMRKELVYHLKRRLRANPDETIASVSQNDWHGNCQCERCTAVDEEEGSPAGTLIRFVNAVAEDIEQEFPNVAVSTLAYQYTRKPPLHVRPRHNVIVRLCSIECSFSVPLADERNRAFRDDIVGWSKICDRLYVWDYVTNFRHHVMPHPNLRVLGPNVTFFVEHNVKGLFEQGAYTAAGAEMCELRAWVLAKLLWDPTLDANALIQEFAEGYYGAAAPHVLAYLETTHDAVEASGDWLGCFSPVDAGFVNFGMLSEGWTHLAAAENAVSDDNELCRRIRKAQLPVLYVFLMRWDEMKAQCEQGDADWPVSDDITAAYGEFRAVADDWGITRLNEHTAGFGALDEAVARAKSTQ